jgi:hypothetical protein
MQKEKAVSIEAKALSRTPNHYREREKKRDQLLKTYRKHKVKTKILKTAKPLNLLNL